MPLVQVTVGAQDSARLTAEIVAALTRCTVESLRKEHQQKGPAATPST